MDDMKLSRGAMIAITVLRVFVGWHFLYEGIAKLTSPSWSAAGYLKQARGPLADLFRSLASQPNLLANADLITMWGLTIVGVLPDPRALHAAREPRRHRASSCSSTCATRPSSVTSTRFPPRAAT